MHELIIWHCARTIRAKTHVLMICLFWGQSERSLFVLPFQCVEVWCPMTGPLMREYPTTDNGRLKQLLYVMNPSNLRATEFLVWFYKDRGGTITVLSDLVYSVKLYATMLKCPLIYGETSKRERQAILGTFWTSE